MGKSTIFHYKWPFSIAFCMFTRGYPFIAVLKGTTASVRAFQLTGEKKPRLVCQVRNDAMYVASGQMVAAPSR